MRHLKQENMSRSDLGWLQSLFHFSFADYYNPDNMRYGVLRVINDDLVASQSGFELHPHRNMEIISYVVDGALTHGDSMGNKRTITRGQVQYMSAGKGIYHSEHNLGSATARFLQIWIVPDKNGHEPQYGDYTFDWEARQGQWLHLVSGIDGQAPIRIHQDVNFYATEIAAGEKITFNLNQGRQGYMVLIEGNLAVDAVHLEARDALEFSEGNLELTAKERSHVLLIEMKS